jgi:hypothetical protein
MCSILRQNLMAGRRIIIHYVSIADTLKLVCLLWITSLWKLQVCNIKLQYMSDIWLANSNRWYMLKLLAGYVELPNPCVHLQCQVLNWSVLSSRIICIVHWKQQVNQHFGRTCHLHLQGWTVSQARNQCKRQLAEHMALYRNRINLENQLIHSPILCCYTYNEGNATLLPWVLRHWDAIGRVITFKSQSVFELHKNYITGIISGTFSQCNYINDLQFHPVWLMYEVIFTSSHP